MDYCDTGCMLGRALQTKETLPDFCKNMDPDNGIQQCGIGSPKIHRNSAGLRVVNGTPGFGVSH